MERDTVRFLTFRTSIMNGLVQKPEIRNQRSEVRKSKGQKMSHAKTLRRKEKSSKVQAQSYKAGRRLSHAEAQRTQRGQRDVVSLLIGCDESGPGFTVLE